VWTRVGGTGTGPWRLKVVAPADELRSLLEALPLLREALEIVDAFLAEEDATASWQAESTVFDEPCNCGWALPVVFAP